MKLIQAFPTFRSSYASILLWCLGEGKWKGGSTKAKLIGVWCGKHTYLLDTIWRKWAKIFICEIGIIFWCELFYWWSLYILLPWSVNFLCQQLKRNFSVTTIVVAGAVDAYCFLTLSLEVPSSSFSHFCQLAILFFFINNLQKSPSLQFEN